jgi:hypothetical protein
VLAADLLQPSTTTYFGMLHRTVKLRQPPRSGLVQLMLGVKAVGR